MNEKSPLDKRITSFKTKLVRPEGVGTWTFAPIPAGVSDQADLKAKMRVKATIDGVPLRSSLMAGDELFIVVAKELRDKIGKQAGDVVKMTLGPDTSSSTVNVPADLEKALSTNEKAKASFEAMALSHKKAYVQWIAQAKTKETRSSRVWKAVTRMSTGETLKR